MSGGGSFCNWDGMVWDGMDGGECVPDVTFYYRAFAEHAKLCVHGVLRVLDFVLATLGLLKRGG